MPNTRTSFEHLGTLLITPQILAHHRVMIEIDRLDLIPRKCYICGRSLKFREFLQSAQAFDQVDKWGIDLLKEIWENEIFILKCCRCFAGRSSGRVSDVLDAILN